MTNLNLLEWIEKIQDLGAGEILIQSIDRDGTSKGYDLDLLNTISKIIKVPYILLGGVGNFDDFVAANKPTKKCHLQQLIYFILLSKVY